MYVWKMEGTVEEAATARQAATLLGTTDSLPGDKR